MAYSAWRWERQMSLQEKKKAWGVLEAFPSFKAKMKLKEKFSIRLIRRTYKWLIKVNEYVKEKGQVTITDFMNFAPEGCAIFLEDAFDIQSVYTGDVFQQRREMIIPATSEATDSDRSSTPGEVDEKNYFSCSSRSGDDSDEDNESELTDKEMKELMELMGGLNDKVGNQSMNLSKRNNSVGQLFGGMLGGMMQGMVGGMFGKDKPLYKMQVEKHMLLLRYIQKNEDTIPDHKLKDYREMLKILSNIISSYDIEAYKGNPLAHSTHLESLNKKLKAIGTPYPAEKVGFDEEKYGAEVLSSMFSGNNANAGENPECSIM